MRVPLAFLWNSLSAMNWMQRVIAFLLVAFALIGWFVDRQVNKLQAAEDNRKEDELSEANRQRDASIAENNRQAADAKLAAAKANERAAQLTKEAEEARLETAKIQKTVEWRSLTAEQLVILESHLSKKPQLARVNFLSGDPEALFFATRLSHAFTGWNLLSGPITYPDRLIIGVTIEGDSPEDTAIVREAFKAAGIPFSITPIKPGPAIIAPFPHAPPGEREKIWITIGAKPRPEMGPYQPKQGE